MSACAAAPLGTPRPRSLACRQPARTVEAHAWSTADHDELVRGLQSRVADDRTAARIPERLDRLAIAWVSDRGATCQAARRGESSDYPARIACQNAVLTAIDALVQRLQTAVAADRIGLDARRSPAPAAVSAELPRLDAGVDELTAALARCDRPAVIALHRAPALTEARRRLAVADLARALGDGPGALAAARDITDPGPALAAHVRIALAWGTWLQGQAPDPALDGPAGDPVAQAELAVLRLFTRPDDQRGAPEAAAALAAVRSVYGDHDLRVAQIHREVARRARLAGADADALAAVDAALAVLDAHDDRDPTPLYAALRHDQGDLEHRLGDYASAEISHRVALAARQVLFGERHRLVAETLHSLANDREARGDLPAAIVLYTRALAIFQATGAGDLASARTANNLGRALYATREFADARAHLLAALQIRQRILGKDHPDTATTLNNLGAVAFAEGDLATARALFDEARQIRERVLGDDHPYTAISLNNFAEVLALEDRVGEAITMHERALAIRLARFGPHHPETARSQHNLGVLRRKNGELEVAEKLLRAAAETRAARLGPDHPETRSSLEQLRLVRDDSSR